MTKNSVVLDYCIDSLAGSVDLLDRSLKSMDEATVDVSRLRSVLSTEKVFGVVPELDLENAKTHLRQQTHPQIEMMMGKIEKEVTKMRRKKTNLAGKVDLQQVRLEGVKGSESGSIAGYKIAKDTVTESKLGRLKFLQNKKERLKYSLSRLNLQHKKARLSEGRSREVQT